MSKFNPEYFRKTIRRAREANSVALRHFIRACEAACKEAGGDKWRDQLPRLIVEIKKWFWEENKKSTEYQLDDTTFKLMGEIAVHYLLGAGDGQHRAGTIRELERKLLRHKANMVLDSIRRNYKGEKGLEGHLKKIWACMESEINSR